MSFHKQSVISHRVLVQFFMAQVALWYDMHLSWPLYIWYSIYSEGNPSVSAVFWVQIPLVYKIDYI